jgi:hypothetical protein
METVFSFIGSGSYSLGDDDSRVCPGGFGEGVTGVWEVVSMNAGAVRKL